MVGTIRYYGTTVFQPADEKFEGSVAGDIFRFERASFRGEAAVDGDKMTGYVVGVAAWIPEGRLFLRRVDRAAPPPVTKR